MGVSSSKRTNEPSKAEINQATTNGTTATILLLGSGESGKSTLFKQMTLLYGKGFSKDYRKEMRHHVITSVLEGTVAILDSMRNESLKIKIDTKAEAEVREAFNSLAALKKKGTDLHWNKNLANAIGELIKDENFVRSFEKGDNHRLQDNWMVVAEKAKSFPKFGGKNWIPDDSDILSCRIRTSGFIEKHYRIDDQWIYRMMDVGGQVNERNRFLGKLFKDIECVLFVSSMGEYNLKMFEDEKKMRILDSLQLWGRVTRMSFFQKAQIILFLNKVDVLKYKFGEKCIPIPPLQSLDENENVESPPLRDNFTTADEALEAAKEWFKTIYIAKAPASHKDRVKVFFTTATDTPCMTDVFNEIVTGVTFSLIQKTLVKL